MMSSRQVLWVTPGGCANTGMQLVAIINEDYAEFLQLSSKLKGVDEAVSSVRSPILAILKRVDQVQLAMVQFGQVDLSIVGNDSFLNAIALTATRARWAARSASRSRLPRI